MAQPNNLNLKWARDRLVWFIALKTQSQPSNGLLDLVVHSLKHGELQVRVFFLALHCVLLLALLCAWLLALLWDRYLCSR